MNVDHTEESLLQLHHDPNAKNPAPHSAGLYHFANCENSILQCYTRIDKHKVPREHLTSHLLSSTPPISYKFFNFLSVIKFDKKLTDEISSTISILRELLSFICTNHQSYALNCGKAYLPYRRRDDRIYMLTSKRYENEKDEKMVKNIADKNLNSMYVPKQLESIVKINYNNPQIIESLNSNTITNILLS